jgi:hypothetical protein
VLELIQGFKKRERFKGEQAPLSCFTVLIEEIKILYTQWNTHLSLLWDLTNGR